MIATPYTPRFPSVKYHITKGNLFQEKSELLQKMNPRSWEKEVRNEKKISSYMLENGIDV